MTMIIPITAYIIVIALTIFTGMGMLNNSIDINQLKLAVAFFVISLFSVIVMTHIIIKNRHEIKGLIFEKDDWKYYRRNHNSNT